MTMHTGAGDLRDRITLLVQTTAQDAAGQPLETWVEHARTWANVRFPSGLAHIKADAAVSGVKASVRIRYRANLPDGLRAQIRGEAYRVTAILPDQRRQWLDLVCERVA